MAKLDPVVLGLLRLHPMTGYVLRQNIDLSVGQFWTASFGGLYPALRRLVGEGLIQRVPGSEAKLYEITKSGHEAFARWFSGAVGKSTVKDEFLLRLFFASDDEIQSLLSEVGRRLAENEDRRATLKLIAESNQQMTRGQQLCLALGRQHLETEQHLLQELQTELLTEPQSRGSDTAKGRTTS